MITLLCLLVFSVSSMIAQESLLPSLKKENIKKVNITRVNSYGYSGGYIDIYNSNRGSLLIEFHEPKQSWGVYTFDLNERITGDYDLENDYSKFLVATSNEDDIYDKIYLYHGDTIKGDANMLDTLYSRELSKLDTMIYVNSIIDKPHCFGFGKQPQLFFYNHIDYAGDEIVYYIRHGNMIKSFEDTTFYRFALMDDCNLTLRSGFNKLTLPENGENGMIDTVKIIDVIVDGIDYMNNAQVEIGATEGGKSDYTYDCVKGYIIFHDEYQRTYFASSSSIFKFNIDNLQKYKKEHFINLGNSFILTAAIGDKNQYTLFNVSNPNGIILSYLTSSIIYDNKYLSCAGPGCYTAISDHTYIRDGKRQYILNLLDGKMIEIGAKWKLLKPFGDSLESSITISKLFVEHFSTFSTSYSDKIFFITPENKIMVFDNGKFYELTKKKIKEMGG